MSCTGVPEGGEGSWHTRLPHQAWLTECAGAPLVLARAWAGGTPRGVPPPID